MSSIYDGSLAAGAGAGTAAELVALAANGSLSSVGSALIAGNIGGALTATHLAAIAAPVMFFTAFSASMKADENKEKARVMLTEAEDKAEKMKTNETLCRAIGERADMFRDLLGGLDIMFAPCVGKLEELVCRKAGYDPYRKIQGYELNDREIALCAVTGSLAKAVKSVLNVPILSGSNEINPEADRTLSRVINALPALADNFRTVY